MKHSQLAETVADAYFSQYVNDDGVMNDPIIVFDTDTNRFSWQSSLTPLQDDEIQVDILAHGGFGDVEEGYDDMAEAEKNLADWLTENDDYNNAIIEEIEKYQR